MLGFFNLHIHYDSYIKSYMLSHHKKKTYAEMLIPTFFFSLVWFGVLFYFMSKPYKSYVHGIISTEF